MSTKILVCPYCGQTKVMMDSDTTGNDDLILAAKLNCDCDQAKQFKRKWEKKQKLVESVTALFGDGCENRNPAWKPVPEETLSEIKRMAEAIAFEKIESVSFVLPDDTKGKITYESVERTRTFRAKLS